MKIYEYDYEITNEYILNKFMGYTVLDIETTGLSREKDNIILIGTIHIQEHTTIKLLFAENLKEEFELLKEINLKDKKIITYNGKFFDLPFIQAKKSFYKLNSDEFTSFDLYQYVKKYNYLLNLDKIRQIDIERYLGISRKEFISGKESTLLYKKYLTDKNDYALE
ncbi:MAG: ribonuclease H-like domain-containing protein, partial [Peptoniphilus sp.]|nr:ribonuclease H-like domain-containing protein [Peptoniphilus sp.]